MLAFLDANPLSRGHTLVIPKAHASSIDDLDAELGRAVFTTVFELTPAVKRAVDAPAANVGFNDGPAAGQEIDHVHGHIIPRFRGDGGGPIHRVVQTRPELTDEEMGKVRDAIAGEI